MSIGEKIGEKYDWCSSFLTPISISGRRVLTDAAQIRNGVIFSMVEMRPMERLAVQTYLMCVLLSCLFLTF